MILSDVGVVCNWEVVHWNDWLEWVMVDSKTKCFCHVNLCNVESLYPERHIKMRPHTQFGKSFYVIYRLTVTCFLHSPQCSDHIRFWYCALNDHTQTQIKEKKKVFLCPCLLYLSALRYLLLNLVTLWPTSPPPHPALLPSSFAEALSQTNGDPWWIWLDRSQELWWVSSNLSREGWKKKIASRRMKNESERTTNKINGGRNVRNLMCLTAHMVMKVLFPYAIL